MGISKYKVDGNKKVKLKSFRATPMVENNIVR